MPRIPRERRPIVSKHEGGLHYFHPDWIEPSDKLITVDVCIYGGTSAGVVAAATLAQRGHSVVVLNPGRHLGGMSSGGLGWTDFGRKQAIGGASLRFYQRVGKHYGKDAEWCFEPRVAEAAFEQIIQEAGVTVHQAQFLHRVEMDGQRIIEVTMLGGLRCRATVFLDATSAGDLLAQSVVAFAFGREPNATYGETLGGIQVMGGHQFSHRVDPFITPGDPTSGLLPQVEMVDQTRHLGRGDHRVQAYNFRVCMTDDPALKVDWQRPQRFDDSLYTLARRWFAGEKDNYNEQVKGPHNMVGVPVPSKFDVFPNKTAGGFHKTDTNNHGPVSSDFIGMSWAWPHATYAQREELFQQHVAYQQGLYWVLANDPAVPSKYRDAYRHWGLPRDEFTDTGHWPHQLYIREARRMVGDYVITEHDCRATRRAEDSIGLGSYNMDSHNCTRFVTWIDGQAWVKNDGDVQVPPTDPYPVSYRCVVPAKGQCNNLIVPVCFSASHIAYGSARMEPVFMVLAESCGLAASVALRDNCSVQDVPYAKLRALLEEAGQVLAWTK